MQHLRELGEQLSDPDSEFWQSVGREDVRAAMVAFYGRADAAIAAQPGTCWNKGECCRFGEFGHRLYVTALEVAYYLASGALGVPTGEDKCPHAFEGKCYARDRRPLGCRIFFCDPAAQHWQGPMTEKLLAELRGLHEELGVPYFYAEWMTILRTLHGRDEVRGMPGTSSRAVQGAFVALEFPGGRHPNTPRPS